MLRLLARSSVAGHTAEPGPFARTDLGEGRRRVVPPPMTRKRSRVVRAGSLESGDRALLNGGCYESVAWITTGDTPDTCVVGTAAGNQVRIGVAQWIVIAG